MASFLKRMFDTEASSDVELSKMEGGGLNQSLIYPSLPPGIFPGDSSSDVELSEVENHLVHPGQSSCRASSPFYSSFSRLQLMPRGSFIDQSRTQGGQTNPALGTGSGDLLSTDEHSQNAVILHPRDQTAPTRSYESNYATKYQRLNPQGLNRHNREKYEEEVRNRLKKEFEQREKVFQDNQKSLYEEEVKKITMQVRLSAEQYKDDWTKKATEELKKCVEEANQAKETADGRVRKAQERINKYRLEAQDAIKDKQRYLSEMQRLDKQNMDNMDVREDFPSSPGLPVPQRSRPDTHGANTPLSLKERSAKNVRDDGLQHRSKGKEREVQVIPADEVMGNGLISSSWHPLPQRNIAVEPSIPSSSSSRRPALQESKSAQVNNPIIQKEGSGSNIDDDDNFYHRQPHEPQTAYGRNQAEVLSNTDNSEPEQQHHIPIPSSSTVPPPQRYTHPRGGHGPPINIKMGIQRQRQPPQVLQNEDDSLNANRTRRRTPRRRPNLFSSVEEESDQDQEVDEETWFRPIKYGRVFRQTRPRGSNPRKARRLTAVRQLMNRLMNISHDRDITKVEVASVGEVNEFEDGGSEGPNLDDFRPYFGVGFRGSNWHGTLREKFIDRLQEDCEEEFDEDQKDIIADMFDERIGRLRREWMKQQKTTEEELQAQNERQARMNRASTRRSSLFETRRECCAGNLRNPDGTIHQGWKVTMKLVTKLGPQGMSSDESSWEGEGLNRRRVYYVKKRKWRSAEVQHRLEVIDNNAAATSAFGGPRAGNAPRRRIRTSTAMESTRDPVIGCPRNFYSTEYVSGLSNAQHRALDIGRSIDLGHVYIL